MSLFFRSGNDEPERGPLKGQARRAVGWQGEMMQFKAPLGGYYEVKAEIVTFKPTGVFEEIKNPKWKWWKFWEPKTIIREKFEKITHFDGSEIKFLKEGDSVGVNHLVRRL